ncbi:MAG: carboxypeptidase-like regulatory domain-containing protein [Clostridia bacterium]
MRDNKNANCREDSFDCLCANEFDNNASNCPTENECCCADKVSCASVNDIIESVALEQTGISHILNTEGEKLQKLLQGSPTVNEMLAANNSVRATVEQITMLEIVLLNKLKAVVNLPCEDATTGSVRVCVKCCKSNLPLCGIFVAILDEKGVVIASGDTNKQGAYTANCIPFGKYVVELIYPCTGEKITQEIELTCKKTSAYVAKCFECEAQCHTIEVSVVDWNSSAPQCGNKVVILDCANAQVDSGATNCDGKFVSKCLKVGKYTVEAYDCSQLVKKSAVVTVQEESCVEKVEFCFGGSAKKISVCGVVTDRNQKPLANACVQINANGQEIVKTDCNGNYCVSNISVIDKFSIFASCNGCFSAMRTINCITMTNYVINLVVK